MNISWNYYRHIAVDASVIFHPLSEDVKMCFATGSVATADTFPYEVSAYQVVVSDEQFRQMVDNLKLFRNTKRVDPLFNREDYRSNELNMDIYGLVCLMSGVARHYFPAQRRSVLLTADLMLTAQVASENIPIDIYLVGVNQLYTPDDFPRLLHILNPEVMNTPAPVPIRSRAGEDLTLYRKDGTPVVLSSYYDRKAGEARIYDSCSISPDYVAKIFRRKHLTAEKIRQVQNLIELNKRLRLNWVLFPLEMLYADPDGENPVGYVMYRACGMRRIEDVVDIQNAYPLTYEPEMHEELMRRAYSDYLRVTLMLSRQCLLLSTYGVIPSDYHPKNYAEFLRAVERLRESGVKEKLLYMWDTDSYCYKNYFNSRWWNRDLVPVGKRSSAAQMCAEALYQAVFSALSLGMCPFYDNKKDRPRFNTIFAAHRHQFFYIPENLRRLFHEVLFCGQPPSIPRLVAELTIALKDAETRALTLEDVHFEADELVRQGAPFWEPPARGPRVPRRLSIPYGPAASGPATNMRQESFRRGQKKSASGAVSA